MDSQNPRQDQLTGLLTRKAFTEEFQQQIARAQNNEKPVSLAFVDIDSFLRVNDQYGHAAGDAIICAVGDIMKMNAGKEATLSRYGGDEFALLFPYREREQAFLILERIRDEIEKLDVKTGDGKIIRGITPSVGSASFPVDGRSEMELLRKADQALYRAKRNGRNQVKLAYEERMVPKTSHYTQTQLERLTHLAEEKGVGEAELLREALDELLVKYGVNDIES